MRIASRVNGLHPGGTTLLSGRKWPSVLYYYNYFIKTTVTKILDTNKENGSYTIFSVPQKCSAGPETRSRDFPDS